MVSQLDSYSCKQLGEIQQLTAPLYEERGIESFQGAYKYTAAYLLKWRCFL